MGNSIKKRGQKFLKKFSKATTRASIDSKKHIKENLFQRISHIQNVRLLILEWGLLAAALIMLAITQAFWLSASYSENTFVSGGTYAEATLGKVNSLNPLFATTSSEKTLARLLFATLTTDDYSGHIGLGLANHIQASEDGKVWKIKLRDNLTWSDGEPLTNSDVMFTIGLIQNPTVNTIYDGNLENVAVSESESGEIVFTLPSQYADFASALKIPIVPKHILADVPAKTLVEDEFSVNPITSGAFTFNAAQAAAPGSSEAAYYLSANPYYYAGEPKIDSFVIHTYEGKNDVIAAINSGTVTATVELTAVDEDKIVSTSYDKRETNINAGAFAFFNTSSGVFKDASLRAAVRQGIDMEEVRSAAPNVTPLDYPLLASQINLSTYPALPEYNFDVAANKVAAAKGDKEISLNVVTVNSGYLPAVSEKIVERLNALGFEASLTTYEESQEFVANIISKRNYDILVYEVELGADPDPLPYYHSSQANSAGLNLSGYRNSLVDDLLIGARETLDSSLRAKKYETFLGYWVSDVPAIGLYQANLTYIYNKNVLTYGDNLHLVNALDRFIDIDEWGTAKETLYFTP